MLKNSMTKSTLESGPASQGNSQETWGDVTSPADHNPNNYRYVVHGLNPGLKSYRESMKRIAAEDPEYEVVEGKDPAADLYNEPERIQERIGILGSLVDHEHHGTYGHAGLIVEPHPDAIIYTAPRDAGSWTHTLNALRKTGEDHDLLTADQLLAESDPNAHNEVAMEAGRVALAGFFYTYNRGMFGRKKPTDRTHAKHFKKQAKRLGLPIVPIKHGDHR